MCSDVETNIAIGDADAAHIAANSPDVTMYLIARIRQLETINEGRRQLNEREHEVLDCAGIKPDATVMERISLLATKLRTVQAENERLRAGLLEACDGWSARDTDGFDIPERDELRKLAKP